MKDPEIHHLWTKIINDEKYKKYIVIDLNEKWKLFLQQVKEYINENQKSPSQHDKCKIIKTLGSWISAQKMKYNPDINHSKFIMKDTDIHTLWTEFINDEKYKKFVAIDLNENWELNLQRTKDYIDENNKRPSDNDKNRDIKSLGAWIGTQNKNYHSNINQCKERMKDREIHQLWSEFINDDKYKYFLNPNENWKQNLNKVKDYMDANNKRPTKEDINKEIKSLATWIGTQKANYNPDVNQCKERMKKKECHALWTEFINDDKYKKHFINPNENWKFNLQRTKDYIKKKKKYPHKKIKIEISKI